MRNCGHQQKNWYQTKKLRNVLNKWQFSFLISEQKKVENHCCLYKFTWNGNLMMSLSKKSLVKKSLTSSAVCGPPMFIIKIPVLAFPDFVDSGWAWPETRPDVVSLRPKSNIWSDLGRNDMAGNDQIVISTYNMFKTLWTQDGLKEQTFNLTTVKLGSNEQLGTGVCYSRANLCTKMTNLPLQSVRYNRVCYNRV